MLKIENLSKIADGGKYILKNISLEVQKGEFIALSGSSGAGKSSLLNVLARIAHFTAGSMSICGKKFKPESPLEFLSPQEIGISLQDGSLIPELSARENMLLPQIYAGKNDKFYSAEQLAAYLNVGGILGRKAGKLSGGEKQRIALIKALSANPRLLLLDEPTANLDPKNRDRVLALLSELSRRGMTIIMATHDKAAAGYASRTVVLRDGQIEADFPAAGSADNNHGDISCFPYELPELSLQNSSKNTLFRRAASSLKEKNKIAFMFLLLSFGMCLSFMSAKMNSLMLDYAAINKSIHKAEIANISAEKEIPADLLDGIPLGRKHFLYKEQAETEFCGVKKQMTVFSGSIFFAHDNFPLGLFSYIMKMKNGDAIIPPDVMAFVRFACPHFKDTSKLSFKTGGKTHEISGIVSNIAKKEGNDIFMGENFYALIAESGDVSGGGKNIIAIAAEHNPGNDTDKINNEIIGRIKRHNAANPGNRIGFKDNSGERSQTGKLCVYAIKEYAILGGIPLFMLMLAFLSYGIYGNEAQTAKNIIRQMCGASAGQLFQANFGAYTAMLLAASAAGAAMYFCANCSRIALQFSPQGYDFTVYAIVLPFLAMLAAMAFSAAIQLFYLSRANADMIIRKDIL